ncbi:uncharacterized protein LOC110977952 [Acanthaster planci]|uniref:Uncharacterized protein LOC110977952 n=1 Tax=Acanthaster planci TaxID=133434 RepID=A0A8B7Y4S0_ACAPL|nr:uncharacterized protein LOC110977952 [Acanthaster planci]
MRFVGAAGRHIMKFPIMFIASMALFTGSLPQVQGLTCSYSCRHRSTYSCGFWGWQQCNRNRYKACYRCCDGWSGSTSSGCSTPICSPSCTNGGRCTRPDYCSNCNRGFYSPRCSSCSFISNCLDVYCSSSTNQRCGECAGDYGTRLGSAYKLSADQRRCIKQCSWRTGSNACYPGTCTNGLCTCRSGFSGTDCRTLSRSQRPTISEYRGTLIKGSTNLESPAAQGSTTTVYTDVTNFTSIQVLWKTSYQPTGLPQRPPYIHSVSLGIVSARVSVSVNKARGGIHYIGFRSCSSAGSRSNPASNLVVCEATFDIDYTSWSPSTGDVLTYTVYSSAGGHMKLFNRDSNSNVLTRYYTSKQTSATATFTFALDGPSHCVGTTSCQNSMLSVGSNVITQPVITVRWFGWIDSRAGIKEYHLQVRQMSGTSGNEMTEVSHGPPVYEGVTASGQTVTLPSAGVYSVVLSVIDNVDNVRRSRRFVFFDDNRNDVTIDPTAPMRVLSHDGATEYGWVSFPDSSPKRDKWLRLDWQGHFLNKRHVNKGLLKPIGPFANGLLDADYDQNFGQRGRDAIPNAGGVAEFRVLVKTDRSGSAIVDPNNENSDNWLTKGTDTHHLYNPLARDGSSVRFWVEARDLAGHSARDSLLFRVDSSPPVVDCIEMIVDLHDISVKFRTVDEHSGLKTIKWRLLENETQTVLEIGTETVTRVNTTEGCSPQGCVCIPLGECYATAYQIKPTVPAGVQDRDFVVMLTVTNQAELETNEMTQISVTAENVGQVSQSLASITSDTPSIDESAVAFAADLLDSIVGVQDTSPEVTENVVKIVSNLLQMDDDRLGAADEVANSSSRIVKSLGRQISNALATGQNISHMTRGLAVEARAFHPSALAHGVGFAVFEGENRTGTFDENSVGIYGSEDVPVEEASASIHLPPEVVNKSSGGDSIPVSFVVYQTSKFFRSQRTNGAPTSLPTSFIDSRVIAATVEGTQVRDLPPESPVVIAFLPDKLISVSEHQTAVTECVFWDFNLRAGIGEWSSEGCQESSQVGGRIVCHCSHATNFAVLVKVHGPLKHPNFALDIFSKIGCGVSIAGLSITVALYLAIRSLRTLEASRILISFCCSLLLLYLVFLAGIEQTSSRSGCIAAAVLMHYFALTSMAWMGVEAANLYLKLVKVFNSDVSHFMVKASLVAWGLPAVLITIILAADYTVYDGEDRCFLKSGDAFYFGQLLIIGLVFLFNLVVFVLVFRKLTCEVMGTPDKSNRDTVGSRLRTMASVAVLLGLTWVFGLLSVWGTASFAFQVLFCIFNSLQGLFVFLLFVVRQRKVREGVSNLLCRRKEKPSESSTANNQLTASKTTGEPSVVFKRGPCNNDHVDYDGYDNVAVATAQDTSRPQPRPPSWHPYDEVDPAEPPSYGNIGEPTTKRALSPPKLHKPFCKAKPGKVRSEEYENADAQTAKKKPDPPPKRPRRHHQVGLGEPAMYQNTAIPVPKKVPRPTPPPRPGHSQYYEEVLYNNGD